MPTGSSDAKLARRCVSGGGRTADGCGHARLLHLCLCGGQPVRCVPTLVVVTLCSGVDSLLLPRGTHHHTYPTGRCWSLFEVSVCYASGERLRAYRVRELAVVFFRLSLQTDGYFLFCRILFCFRCVIVSCRHITPAVG